MGHLGVDFAIFGGDKKTGESIYHESIDFIHTVLKVEGTVRLTHIPIVQDNGLEDGACGQLELFTPFNEPFDQHLAHLDVLRVE